MKTINVSLPDRIYDQLEQLAVQQNSSIDQEITDLLEIALLSPEKPHKTYRNPSEIIAEINQRPRVNPADFGLPDSTLLIREDRDR